MKNIQDGVQEIVEKNGVNNLKYDANFLSKYDKERAYKTICDIGNIFCDNEKFKELSYEDFQKLSTSLVEALCEYNEIPKCKVNFTFAMFEDVLAYSAFYTYSVGIFIDDIMFSLLQSEVDIDRYNVEMFLTLIHEVNHIKQFYNMYLINSGKDKEIKVENKYYLMSLQNFLRDINETNPNDNAFGYATMIEEVDSRLVSGNFVAKMLEQNVFSQDAGVNVAEMLTYYNVDSMKNYGKIKDLLQVSKQMNWQDVVGIDKRMLENAYINHSFEKIKDQSDFDVIFKEYQTMLQKTQVVCDKEFERDRQINSASYSTFLDEAMQSYTGEVALLKYAMSKKMQALQVMDKNSVQYWENVLSAINKRQYATTTKTLQKSNDYEME